MNAIIFFSIVITIVCIIIVSTIICIVCIDVSGLDKKNSKTALVFSDDFTINDETFIKIDEYKDGDLKYLSRQIFPNIHEQIKKQSFILNKIICPVKPHDLYGIESVKEGMFTDKSSVSELQNLCRHFSDFLFGPIQVEILGETPDIEFTHNIYFFLKNMHGKNVHLTFKLHKIVIYHPYTIFYSIIYDRDNNVCGFTASETKKNEKKSNEQFMRKE